MLGTRYESVWAEAQFELVHEACCYAGQLGLVVMCPPLAANRMSEGLWVRGPKPKVEFRGPRPKWRVVSSGLAATTTVGGGGRRCSWVRPNSPWRELEASRERSRPECQRPKKGMVVVRVQGGMRCPWTALCKLNTSRRRPPIVSEWSLSIIAAMHHFGGVDWFGFISCLLLH